MDRIGIYDARARFPELLERLREELGIVGVNVRKLIESGRR
jgi:hypothetical protein